MDTNYIVSIKTNDEGPIEYLDGKGTVFTTEPTFNFSTTDATLHVTQIETERVISKSDERFKENISNVENCLNTISQLSAKKYNYIGKSSATEHIGFLAQDVQSVIPNLVATDSHDRLYVCYQEMIPLLVESVKELKQQQDEILSRLDKLQI